MKPGVIARYISRELLRYLVFFLLIFVSIYLIIDFIQKVDNFVESGASIGPMFAYFFYKTPFIIIQMLPVAALLSVIVMLSLMEKRNEITALKSCGVSVFDLTRPVLILSAGLALFLFLFSELIVPFSSSKSNEIWDISVNRRGQPRLYGQNNIWYKGDDSIYWINHFDPEKMEMHDCTFYFFDENFRLKTRIDSSWVAWKGNGWFVAEGIIQRPTEQNEYGMERISDYRLDIRERPEDFVKKIRNPEEMSYWQLKRYAEKIKREGYDPTRYRVDMNVKLAFPFINIVMAILGVAIVMNLKRGGTPLAVAAGIGACFLYLVLLGLTRSLGLSGVLPPFISAWTANLVFFPLGIYLLNTSET